MTVNNMLNHKYVYDESIQLFTVYNWSFFVTAYNKQIIVQNKNDAMLLRQGTFLDSSEAERR